MFPDSGRQVLLGIALLLSAHAVGAAAETVGTGGAVQGTVRITEKLTEQRMRFRLYPGFKPAPPSADRDSSGDEYRNVVIYIESDTPPAPAAAAETRNYSMAQQEETFTPHVLPVQVGSRVEFPNLDPIFHNVFSLSAARTFDLGRYPRGDSKSVTFDRVGLVPVFCHIHADMSAIIMVLENPYFTVPGGDGRYRIEHIPPGTYTLVAWHERSTPVKHEVEVKDGQTLEFNLTVPIEND